MLREQPQITSLNNDILNLLFLLLDPVSLYYFARVNHFFYSAITNDNTAWEKYLENIFQIKLGPLSKINNSGFFLFKQNANHQFNYLRNEEKEMVSLIAANDLIEIEKRKITFLDYQLENTIANLLSLIKKTGNKKLFHYVLDNLKCAADNLPISDLTLIKFAVAFDLGEEDEKLAKLLSKQNIHLLEIDWLPVLCYAIEKSSACSVKFLLKLGANPNFTQHTEGKPLYLATKNNDLNILNILLAHKEINVNAIFNGQTALYTAAQNGNIEVVKLLVSHNANIDGNGAPPLCAAIELGNDDVIQFLLSHGADSTLINPFSLLYLGARNNRLSSIKLLIAHQRERSIAHNLEWRDREGATTLFVAASRGYLDVCRYLISLGAQIEPHMLHTAIKNKHVEIVKFLLQQPNSEVNHYDGIYTPLFLACENGCEVIVELLLKSHANVNLPSKIMHKTPLYIAAQKGWHKIVNLLLEYDANVHIADYYGLTPYLAAFSDVPLSQLILASLIRAGSSPILPADFEFPNSEAKEIGSCLHQLFLTCPMTKIINPDTSRLIDRTVIIDAIKEYLEKNGYRYSAKQCQTLLLGTFTSFGAAVICYSLLELDKSPFSEYLIKKLGFTSEQQTKTELLFIILSSFSISEHPGSYNEDLFNQLNETVIKPLTKLLEKYQLSEDSLKMKKTGLCLNLFDAQVKKSADLMAQKNKQASEQEITQTDYFRGQTTISNKRQ